MVATTLITSLALLAGAVAAAPSVPQRLHRPRNTKRSNFNAGGNWNGATLTGLTGVSTVSAMVTVPTAVNPPGGPSGTKYSGSAWVGIDGDPTTPLWQTGISWNVQSGSYSYSGWHDWCTENSCGAIPFSGFSLNAGDVISMMVVGTGSSGTAYLENTSTGQAVNTTLTGQSGSLSGVAAEWIVEDFTQSGAQVPFAAFNPITFSGCTYNGNIGVSGAGFGGTTAQPNGQAVDYITQTGPNSFTVTYNGTSY